MRFISLLLTLIACVCFSTPSRADDGYDESEMEPAILRMLAFIEGSSYCLAINAEGMEKISRCLGCNRSIAIINGTASIEVSCREDLLMSRTRFLRLTGLIGDDWSIDAAAMKRASILKRTTIALAQQFAKEAFLENSVLRVTTLGRAVLLDDVTTARSIDVFDAKLTRSQWEGGRFPDLVVMNSAFLSLIEAED